MSRFPQLNPLILHDAVCTQCGEVMQRIFFKADRAPRIEKIIYACYGCDYQVESDQRLTGMCMPIQTENEKNAAAK